MNRKERKLQQKNFREARKIDKRDEGYAGWSKPTLLKKDGSKPRG